MPAASFRNDVMPVLSKAGCNLGGCHGNGSGKGGLKLSLRGQDPGDDWLALAREQGGRRINGVEPEKSLILQKATGAVAHDGGKRFGSDSPEYATLLDWLRDGAPGPQKAEPILTRLTVTPPEKIVLEPESEVEFRVVAAFSDGSERDVTRFAVFEPSNQTAKVSSTGVVTREKLGETTVLVRFLQQQVPVHLAFVPERPGFVWSDPPGDGMIDRAILAKLRTLRMNPSATCTDEVFLRRAYLDLLGIIPSGDESRKFVKDEAGDKRARLIEQLLERDEFADFWALKWADLLKIEQRQLDVEGMKVFHGWIRAGIKANKPLNQFAREIVAARGSTLQNPPANWWRANRDPVARAENTARVFLGTQLNCAQCHNHPFERWTQDDYYNWATLFARVDYKLSDLKPKDESDKNEFRGDQTVLIKASGSVTNPRTNEAATPHFLGGEVPQTSKERDELLALGDWLAASPMFARAQVNRVWYHLLGRGLVEPVDDFRSSNPASHPELLEQLAGEFVAHGYDLRWLIRTIMQSQTYQFASQPNETNREDETNFSHGAIRRLTAEQMLDSMSLALGSPLKIDGQPSGTRMAQVPEGRKHYLPLKSEVDRFGATFGKPPRLIASDCERTNEVALPQAFQLVSGALVQGLLEEKGNGLMKLLNSGRDYEGVVEELFWSILSRSPAPAELASFSTHLTEAEEPRTALEDIAWALLNSKEFLFRR